MFSAYVVAPKKVMCMDWITTCPATCKVLYTTAFGWSIISVYCTHFTGPWQKGPHTESIETVKEAHATGPPLVPSAPR